MADWVEVIKASDFKAGDVKTLDVDGVMVAVFNQQGQYIAIEDMCPHDGSEIASGCIKDGIIECPYHGATFKLSTGEVLSAPAYEPLEMMDIRVENGMIEVRDGRWD